MHLTPVLWRMLPAFWVIGLMAAGFGLPLMLGRVRPNPYYGLQIEEGGDRDDIWYPMNVLAGRDLVLVGARIILVTSVLATFGWRHPQHYVIIAGCVVVAEAALLDGRWKRIGDAALKQVDRVERTERDAGSSGTGDCAP